MCGIKLAAFAQPLGGPRIAKGVAQFTDARDVGFAAGPDEGQFGAGQAEVEQAAPVRVHDVVLALRGGKGQNLDLPGVETDGLIQRFDVLGLGLGVGQKDLGRAGLEDHVGNARARQVGQRLGGEHDCRVGLAQDFEPFPDLGLEGGMAEHDPGFIKDQQRGLAFEALLDAVEQIGQHRPHELVALVHQVLHLEDLEHVLPQAVGLGVEQMAGHAAQGVGLQGFAQALILQQHKEVGQGALRHCVCGSAELGDGAEQFLAVVRQHLEALQLAQLLQPFGGPDALVRFIHPAKGAERQIALLARDVVVLAAGRPAQRQHGIAFVEGEDLRAGIAELLRRHESEQGALSGAGRPKDGGMTQIARVQAEGEGRAAVGLGLQQRRAVRWIERTGVALWPGPDGGQRQQVGQVERVDDGAAHIGGGVAGQRAEIGLDRVHVLHTGAEAAVLDELDHLPGGLVQDFRVFVREQQHAGVVAEQHHAAGRLGQRLYGVIRHAVGVGVDVGGLAAGVLAQQVHHALALLRPLAAVFVQRLLGLPRIEVDEAAAPAVRHGQAREHVQDAGEALRRQAGQGDAGHAAAADAGDEAGGEVVLAEHGVQVHGHLCHTEGAMIRQQADALFQVREKGAVDGAGTQVDAVFETVDGQQGGEAGFHLPDLFLEALQIAVCRGLDPALDEQIGRFARGIGHGEPGDGEDEATAIAHEAVLVAVAAGVVDQPGGAVGECAGRGVARRGRAHGVAMQHPAVPQSQGRVDPGGHGAEFFLCGRVQIGAVIFPGRHQATALGQHDAVVHQRRPGQQVGQAVGGRAELLERHHDRTSRSLAKGLACAG